MGINNSKESQELLIIIDNQFSRKEKEIRSINKFSSIKYEIFDSVQDAFQKKSQKQLKNILTCSNLKTQIIRKMIKHHLTKSKLYVYETVRQNISQEDFDNVYITIITHDLQHILQHIYLNTKLKNKRQIYIPLHKIRLQTQKKINIKIIDYQIQSQFYKKITNQMNSLHLSYEFFDSPSKFENSLLLTISDYIICTQKQLNHIIQILNKNYRDSNLICLSKNQLNSQINSQHNNRYKLCSNYEQIFDIIIKDNKKVGCYTILKQKIFIFSQKYKNTKMISEVQKEFKDLKFEFFQSIDTLLQQIKKQKYSSVLFIQNDVNIIRNFKKKLRERRYYSRVVIDILTTKDAIIKYLDIFFYVCKKKPKSIDFINKNIQQKSLHPHKKQIALNHIWFQKFKDLKQYIKHYEQFQSFFQPFVLCTCANLQELRIYLQSKMGKINYNDCKIICFDSRQKINILKKQWVFDKNPIYAFASSNIKQIVQFIKSNKFDYLICDTLTADQHLQKYNRINQKFKAAQTQKTEIVKLMTTPFATFQNDFFCKQQLGFILSQDQEKLNIFIRQLVEQWSINYNPLIQLKTLKDDIKDILFFCLQNEIIKTSDQNFQILYINKIQQCNTISQLLSAGIYIYTLPHGLSQCINKLFIQFKYNLMILKKFSAFILLLVLNFCVYFSDSKIQKIKLKVYLENPLEYKDFQPRTYRYNLNFLNCLRIQQSGQECTKDCIQIQHEYYPLQQGDIYNSLIYIEPFSFYKESFEYIFAPYTKFYVQQTAIRNDKRIVRLKSRHKNTFLDGFLKKIFEISNIQSFLNNLFNKQNQTIIPVEDIDKLQKIKTQMSFINSMKSKFFYKAANYLEIITQNMNRSYINNSTSQKYLIYKLWLLINQGKHHKSQQLINDLKDKCQQSMLPLVKNMSVLLNDIKKKRQLGLSEKQKQKIWKVEYKSNTFEISESTLSWSCGYSQKGDQFLLTNKKTMTIYSEVYQDIIFNKKLNQQSIVQQQAQIYKKTYLQHQLINQLVQSQINEPKKLFENILQLGVLNIKTRKNITQQKYQKQLADRSSEYQDDNLSQSLVVGNSVQEFIRQKQKVIRWKCQYYQKQFIIVESTFKKKHLKIKKKKKISYKYF